MIVDLDQPDNNGLWESQEFVKNAVSLAMWRDGSSGGVIRTVTISKDGVEREMTLGDKLPQLHAKWCP